MFENKGPNKFMAFMKKHGIYFVVAVCIMAVGTIGYLAVSSKETPKEQGGQSVQKQQSPTLEEQMKSASPSVAPSPAQPSASASEQAKPQESKAATSANQGKVYLQMPLKGEITRAFSGDDLVYNETMNLWATHNGIDISAAEDDEVKAAMAGTVKRAEADNILGHVVIIEHSGNQRTIYAGLEELSVKEGDKVNAGQKIGKAGTPPFEQKDGAHLHFEYEKNGEFIDPVSAMEK